MLYHSIIYTLQYRFSLLFVREDTQNTVWEMSGKAMIPNVFVVAHRIHEIAFNKKCNRFMLKKQKKTTNETTEITRFSA